MAGPKSVEGYLAALPDHARDKLETLRATIKAAAPHATEAIAYQMPAFKDDGRPFVYYGAFTDHYSLFPGSPAVIEAVGDALTPYVTGKGTISFSYDERLPIGIVKKVVKARLAENAARSKK